MSAPGNARGAVMGATITVGLAGLSAMMKRPRLRELLRKRAPQPGEGPAEQRQARGHWTVRFVAEDGVDKLLYLARDDRDPSCMSTATMLGESALCLAYDKLDSPGGVLTPSVPMDGALLDRLRAAGLVFAPG